MFEPLYIRDSHERWVRAIVEEEAVEIALQERIVQRGGMIVGLGVHDEEIWRRSPVEAPTQRRWLPCARIVMDARWNALGATGLEWPQVLRGIQRHVTALIAGGWGNPLEELIACFEDPSEQRLFVVDQIYEVVRDYGPLEGFVGQHISFQREDASHVITLRFLKMPHTPIPMVGMEWVRALLMATHPIVGCILPTQDETDA